MFVVLFPPIFPFGISPICVTTALLRLLCPTLIVVSLFFLFFDHPGLFSHSDRFGTLAPSPLSFETVPIFK